jgi:hypothetical protein
VKNKYKGKNTAAEGISLIPGKDKRFVSSPN